VTVDAFQSLKSVCCGFAAVACEFCERQDRVINLLSKTDQDVNEKQMIPREHD
jgi:hypothetical protein